MSEEDLVFNLQCLQRRTARKRFRKDILDAWNNICAYCGDDRAHTLDHIIPRAKGGSTKRCNLLACCPTCNLDKSDSDWFQWFRAQSFWSHERETKILEWVNRDHNANPTEREYEELRQQLLIPPAQYEEDRLSA